MSSTDFSSALWRKSSRSSQEGDQCVELALAWQRSSHSGQEGGTCVELADCGAVIGIRDSKDPAGPVLELSGPAFAALLEAAKTSGIGR